MSLDLHYELDEDGDGHGVEGAHPNAVRADCDDDPGSCGANCFPDQTITDGMVDDGDDNDCLGGDECFLDGDGDGYGVSGVYTDNVSGDCSASNEAPVVGDCADGVTEQNPDTVWYHDADGDGVANLSDTVTQCAKPAFTPPEDWTFTAPAETDCDDADEDEFPGQEWYADCDNDGAFRFAAVTACDEAEANSSSPCTGGVPPTGGWTNTQPLLALSDCDDQDINTFPGQAWYADCDADTYYRSAPILACSEADANSVSPCPLNAQPDSWTNTEPTGLDIDCDDEDINVNRDTVWYHDADGDGAASLSDTLTQCDKPAFTLPEDWTYTMPSEGDCDDADNTEFPGQDWFPDCDGDTFHRAASFKACDVADANANSTCTGGATPTGGYDRGTLSTTADCDDEDEDEFPGQEWYADCDNDTFLPLTAIIACDVGEADGLSTCSSGAPLGGWSNTAPAVNNDDCNNEDPATYPGAFEVVADEIDQSCDGMEICYEDEDNDGFINEGLNTVVSTNASCQDSGEAADGESTGDCNDLSGDYYPGAPDDFGSAFCGDGEDHDCDGAEALNGGGRRRRRRPQLRPGADPRHQRLRRRTATTTTSTTSTR